MNVLRDLRGVLGDGGDRIQEHPCILAPYGARRDRPADHGESCLCSAKKQSP
jgi:hypothetical protein